MMPAAKPRPSDIAAEAKRLYLPHVARHHPQFPARSIAYSDAAKLLQRRPSLVSNTSSTGTSYGEGPRSRKLRLAVIDGDPIDVALDWHDSNCSDSASGSTARSSVAGSTIPVVNPANEKRAGGDWETGLMAPEECLCRRSTLAAALVNPFASTNAAHYPIRQTGGIYSPSVGE